MSAAGTIAAMIASLKNNELREQSRNTRLRLGGFTNEALKGSLIKNDALCEEAKNTIRERFIKEENESDKKVVIGLLVCLVVIASFILWLS